MAEVRLRTVDSFTDRPFTGNPAAVLLLDHAPPDEWMAAVARETNVSDTGFVIRETLPDADFRLRWFTPMVEVDLWPWDAAAPMVLIEEAGGRVTDLDGRRAIDSKTFLATNGLLHDEVLERLRG